LGFTASIYPCRIPAFKPDTDYPQPDRVSFVTDKEQTKVDAKKQHHPGAAR
jgi:hypothetical protein